MAYFYSDADLPVGGNFDDVANVGERFQCSSDKVAVRFRWRSGTVLPGGTPAIRLFDNSGALLATIPFDGPIVLDSWNVATPAAPIAIPANTLRWMAVNTTRYVAKSFFDGGSVTRGAVTQTTGNFAAGSSVPNPPTSTTVSTFFVDVDLEDAPEEHTSTGTARATALGTDVTAAAKPTTGTATATATATGAVTTSRVTTGTATATATATDVTTPRRVTTGTATATATATDVTTPRRVTTGVARAVATASNYRAPTVKGPRLVSRRGQGRIVTRAQVAG